MADLKYRLTDDAVFKIMFDTYPELLKHLVAALLFIPVKSITYFKVDNAEVGPNVPDEKFSRYDLYMGVNDIRVVLEIQPSRNKSYNDFVDRFLYYFKNSLRLKKGDKRYTDATPVVVISILGFNLFERKRFHSSYSLREDLDFMPLRKEGDKLRILYYELPKLPLTPSRDNLSELFLSLINAKTEEDLEKLENLGVDIVTQAIHAFCDVSESSKLKRLIKDIEIGRRNEEEARLKFARRKAAKKAAKKATIRLALELLDGGELSRTKILQITKLSEDELEEALEARNQKK
jgi:predicted transposase/invertase (TIGR01784 family)